MRSCHADEHYGKCGELHREKWKAVEQLNL